MKVIKNSFFVFFAMSFGSLFSAEIVYQLSGSVVLALLNGSEASRYCEQIASLRIHGYAEFPFLYQGTYECEKEYLEHYFNSKKSRFLIAFDGDKIVGLSIAIPLVDELDEVKQPFIKQGININTYAYIGDMVILPNYRHLPILSCMFKFYEQYVDKFGYEHIFWAIVDRPIDHPDRPKNYNDLAYLWNDFGYYKQTNIALNMAWKELNKVDSEMHTLSIWQKNVK